MRIISNSNNSGIYNSNISKTTFSAMKKSQFIGIDYAVVEMFKAPIEKFNEYSDFSSWAEGKLKDILGKNYEGRSRAIEYVRKKYIDIWLNNIKDFSSGIKLYILNGITKNLGKKNDNIPPDYDSEILKDTVKYIENLTILNPKMEFNFDKEYKKRRMGFVEADNKDNVLDGGNWIIIPSGEKDSVNFDSNVKKLKLLSSSKWCTKGLLGKLYLQNNDIHIYLENNIPQIGIRINNGTVCEIQGIKNDSTIPLIFYDMVMNHVKDFKFSNEVLSELEKYKEQNEKLQNIKRVL